MRRLTLAVCLAALTLAFAESEIAGQRRVGIPRPRPNQPAQPSQPSTPAPTPAPSENPAQPAAQPAAATQGYKPAIEYQSFMQLRFYENQGGFLVEDLQVVFPPSGRPKATFVVARAGGQVVTTVPLRLEAPLDTFTAFGRFVPDGVPGNARVGEPGDYVLSVQIDGQPITTLPFSMKRESSNDPFNPTTTFVREGLWRDLAHFSHRPDVPDSHLELSWWTSLRELPAGSPQRSLVTVHILHGGQEIATTRSPVVVTQTDWQLFQQEFHFPEEKKVRWMTLADLTRRDGEYTVVAKVNGKPFKSYKAQVRGGQLQRHPRNSLDTQPHTAFISPRLVDTSRRVSTYAMRDTYWITRN